MDARFVVTVTSGPPVEADLITVESVGGGSPRLVAFRNNKLVTDRIEIEDVLAIEVRWHEEVRCSHCSAVRQGPPRTLQLTRARARAAAVGA